MSRLAELSPSAVILVLAPVGRDAEAIARVLTAAGLQSARCVDMNALGTRLGPDTLMVLVTEEGLASGMDDLVMYLDDQPAWSDLPIIVLGAGGPRRGGAARWRLFERLGNVTILDRPLHAGAIQSAVRAGLRGRRRQYQARGHFEELEAARSSLEERVADRTRALRTEMAERRRVQEALLHAQRLEAIGQLTGGVAHDFNNLLQVVMGGLSVLERHGANAERRERILAVMRQAGERGAKLTQQLLAFARRQPLSAEPINVAARIENMQELFRGSLRADIELCLRLLPHLWSVEADATQLEVALLNLVVNARDAMPTGGKASILAENVVLGSDTALHGLAGEFVRVTVTDTGIGMDEATINHAFEPFFTTKPLGHGTGLGLSQIYGFVRQSGGGVHIESTPGSGTAVSLYLPRSLRAPPQELIRNLREAEHAGGLVLVVEDEPQVASLTCAMLEELGYRCEHVGSADAAMEIDMSRFMGVFSDVIMPGRFDGIALAQELRRRWPELPILLTTGFAGAPERIATCGFPVLKKPYGLEELSLMVSSVFKRPTQAPNMALQEGDL